jgi:hypothetical protein
VSKLIKFIPSINPGLEKLLKYVEIPKPASKFIPQWWKDQSLKRDENDPRYFDNFSFKACVPFLDSLTTGYMMYTQQDIYVNYIDGLPFVEWGQEPEPLVSRDDKQNLPVPAGHSSVHFAWNFLCGIELPKGYSVLVTHPLNRFDLPFTTVSGIIDQGVPWSGSFTFWLKEGFLGLIPQGTPIAQIIPFKRDDWKSERADYLIQKSIDKKYEHQKFASGHYKKFFHKRKRFE